MLNFVILYSLVNHRIRTILMVSLKFSEIIKAYSLVLVRMLEDSKAYSLVLVRMLEDSKGKLSLLRDESDCPNI